MIRVRCSCLYLSLFFLVCVCRVFTPHWPNHSFIFIVMVVGGFRVFFFFVGVSVVTITRRFCLESKRKRALMMEPWKERQQKMLWISFNTINTTFSSLIRWTWSVRRLKPTALVIGENAKMPNNSKPQTDTFSFLFCFFMFGSSVCLFEYSNSDSN